MPDENNEQKKTRSAFAAGSVHVLFWLTLIYWAVTCTTGLVKTLTFAFCLTAWM